MEFIKKMSLKDVKKELEKLEKKELIKHIGELYKKYKNVKEYFDFYVSPDEETILETYKLKVREGFYPKRGFQLKLSIARKAINDFKKLGVSSDTIADLLLYYVECGVEFTNEFGDIDESFYNSIESTYLAALKLLEQNNALSKFEDRAFEVLKDTENIGWGFHDQIYYYTYQYYPEN